MIRRRWTEEEDAYLEDAYGNVRVEAIAKRLNRSVGSVRNRVQVMSLGPDRPADVLSLNGLMAILGMQSHQTVMRWMRDGLLKGKRSDRYGGAKSEWWFKQDDLAAFLTTNAHLVDRDKIEPPFRQFVSERWLTLVEAFRRGAAWAFLLENAVKAGLIPEARQRGDLGTWWVIPERILPELVAARRRMTSDADHRKLLLLYQKQQSRGRVQRRMSYLNSKARAGAPGGRSGRQKAAA